MTKNPYYIIKPHIVKYRLPVAAKGVNVSQLAEAANPGELNHIDLQSFLRSVTTICTFVIDNKLRKVAIYLHTLHLTTCTYIHKQLYKL